MFLYEDFVKIVGFIHKAHFEHPRKLAKRTRRWDGNTPYAMHPLWCAMTILTESSLPAALRIDGAHALLLHDILEDSELPLPPDTPMNVKKLVEEMTFDSTADETSTVWRRSRESKLLKLYDKVHNIMDGAYMSKKNRDKYINYTLKLLEYVEQEFGPNLNIIKIARAFVK